MIDQALNLLLRHTVLLSLAVLLLALLRPLLLRGLGASAVYLAWLLVPLMTLSPSLPQLPQQHLTLFAKAAPPLLVSVVASQSAPAPAPAAPAPHDPFPPPARVGALALWLAGALALGLLLAWRQRRFTARLCADGQDLLRAPAGSSPALLGIWRPRLVLPQDFEERFDADERRLILAHEAVHARRRDNAWNLLAAALLALQWFNPLAWWALGRMRADQELACDATVLNQLGEEDMSMMKRYLGALLKSCPAQRMPVLANGWGHQHPLLERARLLGRHRRSAGRRRLGTLAALALCAGVTVLARAAQPDAPPAMSTGAGLGVVLHLDAQPDRQDARHSELRLELPAPGSVPDALDKRVNLPQGDWCLGLLPHGIPGGAVRPLAQLMDARCQTALTDWVAVPVGRGRYSLSARLGQQDLLVRVGLEWVDPKDPRIPEEMQREARDLAASSARQQAQLEQQRAKLAAAAARQRTDGTAALPAPRHAPPAPAPAPAPVPAPSSMPAPASLAAPAPAASAAPLPAPAPIRLALDLEVIERSEASSRKLQAKPVLLLKPGSVGTVRLPMHRTSAQGKPSEGEADDTLELQLSARDLGEGLLMIESQLRLVGANRLLASPWLRVREGERARIETGQSVGSDVQPFIRLDLVATRDPAPQQP